MASPEYRNNPPQEVPPAVDKTGNLKNSSELAAQHFDIVKPHASALLGLPQVEASINVPSPSLSTDVGQIRAKRREEFEQTGYIPPLKGGAPKRIELPIDEIVAAYRNRVPVEEIAKQYYVNPATIYNRLHEAGIRRHPYKQREKDNFEIPDEEVARRRIEEILTTKWDRKTYVGKEQLNKAMREIALLREHYRETYNKVWSQLLADIEG